jgi:hypothetical protein
MHRLYADWSTKLTDKIDFMLGYAMIFAEDNTNTSTYGLSTSGKFRGQLLKGSLKLNYTKNLVQSFDAELFFPGNYYSNDRNDVAVFAKTDIVFTW